jgi:hypothetical protein
MTNTNPLREIATIVYPARDLPRSIAAWTAVTGTPPMFATADYAAFRHAGTEIGLTRLPWVDFPLVIFAVDDIDISRKILIDAGCTPMAEVAGGGLSDLSTVTVTNGDPDTGVVDVNGARLAVMKLTDGTLIGLRQSVTWDADRT